MPTTNFLTKEGFQKLQEELDHLRTSKRQEVAARLHEAMEGGELIENAEYEAAKNEQAFIEGEILRLETILSSAQIIQESGKKDVVTLGSRVTVIEQGGDEKEVYHVVGSAEANPAAGKISLESPLGKALLGAKVGEKVNVNAPGGQIVFVIKAIG